MAVPGSWCQKVFEKLNILLFMTISNTAKNRLVGKELGMLLRLDVKKLCIDWRPEAVSILVYIDTASAKKRRVP